MHARMKRILPLFLLCVALFALALCAAAETKTGTCGDNLTYTLDTDTGVLTISGTGEMEDFGWNGGPWYSDCSSIRTVVIADGVTSIGKYAFYDCSSLESITIPDGVTSIGASAFENCSSFTSFTIPYSVTEIEYCAFESCSSLTAITIPACVRSIGFGAFANCSSLARIEVDAENKNYCSVDGVLFNKRMTKLVQMPGACVGAYTILEGVTEIEYYAFYGSRLTRITIPDSVTEIESRAFENCSSLTRIDVDANNPNYCSVDGILYNKAKTEIIAVPGALSGACAIPNGVTKIVYSAFEDCSGLTSLTIPASVTSIGQLAFRNCARLTRIDVDANNPSYCSVDGILYNKVKTEMIAVPKALSGACTIPNGMTSIEDYAFSGCSGLTGITIPDSVTSIGEGAFSSCSRLANVTIGNGVTNIGEDAFSSCESLTNVTIPDSVTSIGEWAFDSCSHLTSVTLGNGVTSIGDYAFSYCKSLTNVTIPDSVTIIGNGAFSYCDNLTSVTVPAGVTEIGTGAFAGCDKLTRITVAADNPNYCSVGGVLFNKDKTVLMQAPGALAGAYTVPAGVRRIDNSAFAGCDITSITIPQSVTEIGAWAFSGTHISNVYIEDLAAWCAIDFGGRHSNPVHNVGSTTALYQGGSRVTQVQIPADWTEISAYALSGFQSITRITTAADNPNYTSEDGVLYNKDKTVLLLVPAGKTGTYTAPASVTAVANYACVNGMLTAVRLQGGVRTVGDGAFERCSQLSAVTLSEGLTRIGNYAFFACGSLTRITIPDSLTDIGSSAFEDCGNLAAVILSESLTTIGDSAFEGCSSLTAIVLPESLTDIGYSAFEGCSSLTAIVLPESLTNIGYRAFRSSGLRAIVVPKNVKKLGRQVFDYCKNLTSITILNPTCDLRFFRFYGKAPDYASATATIYGHGGSTAEKWAKENNRTFIDLDAPHTHSYSRTFTIDVPATCSTVGSKSRHCTVEGCNAKTDITEIPKAAHDYSTTWTIDTPAACTTPGEKSHHCKNCSAKTDITVIPATGHKPAADWTIDVAAGCVTDGSKSHHCTVCDEKLDVTVIPAVGVHKDADGDGKCDDCGKLFGEGWELDDATGELTVTGSGTVTDTNWKAVADKVKVIKIDSGITSLPDDAFAGCTDITIRCEAGSYAADYAREHGYKTSFINSAETADGTVVAKGLADGAIPEGTTLTVTPVDKSEIPASVLEKLGKEPEFDVIDIIMEKDGEAVQPSGKIAVTVRVDAEKRYKVYRVNADGTLTVMNAAVDGDKLTFEADTTGRYLVQVRKFIPGVVTGEGEKPMKKDLLRLQKYLAGWDVEIDEAAADCNGDGQISKADLLRLQKYLAGWDVKLGE